MGTHPRTDRKAPPVTKAPPPPHHADDKQAHGTDEHIRFILEVPERRARVTAALADMFRTWEVANSHDIADALTCREVDGIVNLLKALGMPESADRWATRHAITDYECNDTHHDWFLALGHDCTPTDPTTEN
jgi:hypothetical protein